MEIIEDKAIQNICGRGKIIIKYSDEDGDDSDNYLTIDITKTTEQNINKIINKDISNNSKQID